MKSKIVSKIISYLPFNFLRIFVYKYVLGYKIGENVKIGKRTIIKAKKVILNDNVIIGNYNLISCNEFQVGKNTIKQSICRKV